MALYVSVTKVKEIVSDVLEPIMKQAKVESNYAKTVNGRLEEMGKTMKEQTDALATFRTKVNVLDDLQRAFTKFQGDFLNYQAVMETRERAFNTTLDGMRYENDKMKGEHEVDQGKIKRCENQFQRLERDFDAQCMKELEILARHEEEYRQLMCGLDARVVETENALEILEKDHFDLNRIIVLANNRLEKLQIDLDAETLVVQGVEKKKLDEKSFKMQAAKWESDMDNMKKRIGIDETEIQEFANYITRYMPILLINSQAEILRDTLDYRGIVKLEKVMLSKHELYKNMKENKIRLLYDILDQKK